jgi:hypothetical protein
MIYGWYVLFHLLSTSQRFKRLLQTALCLAALQLLLSIHIILHAFARVHVIRSLCTGPSGAVATTFGTPGFFAGLCTNALPRIGTDSQASGSLHCASAAGDGGGHGARQQQQRALQ